MRMPSNTWDTLSSHDLEAWAGSSSVSRGQTYQRQGRVCSLVRTSTDRLLATVTGGDNYHVSLSMGAGSGGNDRIQAQCSCGVGDNRCKHAVAVVAEYLDRAGREDHIPIVNEEDPRWLGAGDSMGQAHGDDGQQIKSVDGR